MGIKLYNCDCEFIEIPNNAKGSKVKGYSKVKECIPCKTTREAQAAQSLQDEADRKEAQALQERRQVKLNEIADTELAKEVR